MPSKISEDDDSLRNKENSAEQLCNINPQDGSEYWKIYSHMKRLEIKEI